MQDPEAEEPDGKSEPEGARDPKYKRPVIQIAKSSLNSDKFLKILLQNQLNNIRFGI